MSEMSLIPVVPETVIAPARAAATPGQPLEAELGFVVVREQRQFQEVWDDCREHWLRACGARGSENTVEAYRRAWFEFYYFLDGMQPAAVRMCDVHPGHIHEWVSAMEERKLSKGTINQKLAAMSSFYAHAGRKYYLQGTVMTLWDPARANPFQGVDRFRLKSYGRRVFPTGEEVKRLLEKIPTNTVQGLRDMALILGVFVTTRRSDEWLGMKWGDIRRGEAGWLFDYRCKGGEVKTQQMPNDVLALIKLYLKTAKRWPLADGQYMFTALNDHITRMKCGVRVDAPADCQVLRWLVNHDDEVQAQAAVVEVLVDEVRNVIFAPAAGRVQIKAEQGDVVRRGATLAKVVGGATVGEDYRPGEQPLSNHQFNDLLKKYGRRAMVPEEKLHVHGLRHAGARLRHKRGDSIEMISDVLGHANITITMVYVKEVLEEPEDPSAAGIFEEMAPRQLKMRLGVE